MIYHVSYCFLNGKGSGFGSTSIRVALPLSWADIVEIGEKVKEDNKHDSVVVLSFQPLREDDEDDPDDDGTEDRSEQG